MALDAKAIDKPFRKLRKLLKNFPDPPGAEVVHDVRTHTRRVEAMVGAFQSDSKRSGKNLVKHLKPIRKAAGGVRDMDVLTDLAASIDPGGNSGCRLRLMHYLADRRTRAAATLAKKANAKGKSIRSELKKYSAAAHAALGSINNKKAKEKDKESTRAKAASSMASSLEIEQEMRGWPRLTANNIHPFRLKVKELRYILQLGQGSDSNLIDALGKVKDQIGLWHDWYELERIASEVLDHDAHCHVMTQIRAHTKEELKRALDSTNALRSQYLNQKSGSKGKKSAKKRVVSEPHPAIISATSRLAS